MPTVQQRDPNKPPIIAKDLFEYSTLSAALFFFVEVWVLFALALAADVPNALVPFPISLTPKLLVGVALAVSKLVTLVGR